MPTCSEDYFGENLHRPSFCTGTKLNQAVRLKKSFLHFVAVNLICNAIYPFLQLFPNSVFFCSSQLLCNKEEVASLPNNLLEIYFYIRLMLLQHVTEKTGWAYSPKHLKEGQETTEGERQPRNKEKFLSWENNSSMEQLFPSDSVTSCSMFYHAPKQCSTSFFSLIFLIAAFAPTWIFHRNLYFIATFISYLKEKTSRGIGCPWLGGGTQYI